MPAKYFRCPDGGKIEIEACLKQCISGQRCMFLPTLRAVAKSLHRDIPGFSITELLSGTREMFLKKTCDYAVDPQQRLFALHGSAMHTINEGYTEGDMLYEERLFAKDCSGQFDLFGSILDNDTGTLGDIKVTSSFKLMKALGMYKVDVPTGEVYKTGNRKGQEKTVKEWRFDGVRNLMDWAIQLNYYRMLLESHSFIVNKMVIQALCRDSNLRNAGERGINKQLYLIPINKISDHWIKRYIAYKAAVLNRALDLYKLPLSCRPSETWHGRKCDGYCSVAGHCNKENAAEHAA